MTTAFKGVLDIVYARERQHARRRYMVAIHKVVKAMELRYWI